MSSPSTLAPAATAPTAEVLHQSGLTAMSLGALGVVYGDIGTSPLYAMKECFAGEHHALAVTHANVLGVLSLVVWSLVLVIVLKYISFILRADNRGEGGVLALVALQSRAHRGPTWTKVCVILGLFGAGLLYGDGAITPAISILGAVEGVKEVTPSLGAAVVPITVCILIGLFAVQRFGTAKIGTVFGWVMLAWFAAIAVAGLAAVTRHPSVVQAISPHHAVRFFIDHGVAGFLLLGSVVLVVTGGEALYADMGHFGRTPIRRAWYAVVMPALLLNYFGQGALLLERGGGVANPFYALAPGPWLYPMLVIATLAAIIASQALISGAFSLTRGAIQLGYFPRVRIVHTSGETEGQIYIPEVNWFLMIACVALVVGFKSSGNLAAAYGIAVTGTMAITSVLFFGVARGVWGWSRLSAGGLVFGFLTVDLAFLTANVPKIGHGGWFPLVAGTVVFIIMTSWRRGRMELAELFATSTLPIEMFLADLSTSDLHRVPGTAVFMTSNADGVPPVLLHHVKHTKMLHEQVVLLSISTDEVPTVPITKNFEVEELGQGFFRVKARYGFMQSPQVPRLLARCLAAGLFIDLDDTSYYLGRETLLTTGRSRMPRWRKGLFAFLSRNSRPATQFFGLPPNRVVELGAQIQL
ncbi:MAG TPA: potassium transporter Kup [Kofleriaceae bacterium]|nr:potassium transporter Kup [Kofleriaceae bacterium]